MKKNKSCNLLFAGSILLISCTSPASAQVIARSGYYKVVRPGADVTMGTFFGLNPDCSSTGEYQINLLVPPKMGQIYVDKHYDYPTYPSSNVRSVCNRRKILGTRLIYQANKDATGSDVFNVEIIYPSSVAVKQIYVVRVE